MHEIERRNSNWNSDRIQETSLYISSGEVNGFSNFYHSLYKQPVRMALAKTGEESLTLIVDILGWEVMKYKRSFLDFSVGKQIQSDSILCSNIKISAKNQPFFRVKSQSYRIENFYRAIFVRFKITQLNQL